MVKRDANDILREQGPEGVRTMNDRAQRYEPKPGSAKTRRNQKGTRNGTNAGQKSNGGAGPGNPAQAIIDTAVTLDDFYAYMPMHKYIFAPTREMWPASSVNKRIQTVQVGIHNITKKPVLVPASDWLDKYQAVEQMTWAPGEPMLIQDRLIAHGGWITRPGCTTYNLYRPPTIQHGDPARATTWLDHVKRIYPNDADHIIAWFAQRVQRPGEKINHALVLGGAPGIGKDSILQPIKHAVGPWNFEDIVPMQLLGRFNGFVRSVILRVSEGRDLGDWDRYSFYEHLKLYTAEPPDVIRCDEKNIREHSVCNVCGVVLTTNHKTDGIYLPADDRRHLVAWSVLTQYDFAEDYWRGQYAWYANGGNEAVAAYLASYDISNFDPKAPPPKTQAFWEIANANRAPEDAELMDVLDELGQPDVVTLDRVADHASALQPAFSEWLRDKINARRVPHRFEDCGYIAVRNPNDSEGRWKISGRRHTIYGKTTLTERERLEAAFELTGAR